eukprot:UN04774
MAENKQIRAQTAHEQAKAYKAKNPDSHIVAPVPPSFIVEQNKVKLINSIDLPRKQVKMQDALLNKVAESGLHFEPVEVGQILSLVAVNGGKNYVAGSKLVQDLVDRDYLPYKSAIRALGRLYEHAHHYPGAKAVMHQLNNLYPAEQYDEVGMPLPKQVLTTPLPNFNELAQTPTTETDLKAMEEYFAELKNHVGIAPRYKTQLQYTRQLLKQGREDDAAAELFKIFHRCGIADTAAVPTQFQPVKFHADMRKLGSASEFPLDFPLMYNIIDRLTS